MTDKQHGELLEAIQSLAGFVIISTYPNEMYSKALKGWDMITIDALADGARPRIEALFLSPNCRNASKFQVEDRNLAEFEEVE
jgi:DNA adenine methylase